MKLQITHETRYAYTPAVEVAQHICHLRPVSNSAQTLLAHSLQISPEPAEHTNAPDIYGNTRSFFSMQASHRQLQVVARSIVATTEPDLPASSVIWELVRERFRYRAGSSFDSAGEFVFPSPYVPRHGDFSAFARPSFAPGQPLLLAACDLMARIHTEFTYESQSTEVNTPALEALAQRKGVCQDFAHIMIACLRALGLSARYVSGYLLTQPPPGEARLVGSDASHAWASVYLPDLPEGRRWCDFDPTNNRFGWGTPGEDYVTLAVGRDFGDVSPIRGVIQGGADHSLWVGVTVEPMEDVAAGLTQTQTQTQTQSQSQSQSQNQTQSQSHSSGH
jgi:transglutaminase-like putative cysteine protease